MGFNPTKSYRKSKFDYWFVAIGLLVLLGLVLWALVGWNGLVRRRYWGKISAALPS